MVQDVWMAYAFAVVHGLAFASAAFDLRGSYDVIFRIYVGLSILGGVLIFLARQPRHASED